MYLSMYYVGALLLLSPYWTALGNKIVIIMFYIYLNNRKVKLNQTQFEFELFSNDIF